LNRNAKERFVELELLKRVGVLHFHSRAEEIKKLEELLTLQDRVMSELSNERGRNLIRLLKLRGVLPE
jgi:predicted nuclease with RNAse H fold